MSPQNEGMLQRLGRSKRNEQDRLTGMNRGIKYALAFTALSAAAFASVWIALLSPTRSFVVLLCIAILIVFRLIRHRLAPIGMSPLTIATFGLLALAILGAVFYSSVQRAAEGGGASVILTEQQTAATFAVVVTASLATLVGGVIGLVIRPRVIVPIRAEGVRFGIPPSARAWVLLASMVPLIVIIVGSGERLLRRDLYIAEAVQNGAVLGLAGQLAVAAVIALGYLAASGKGFPRFVAIVTLIGYTVVFIGGGSRRLAMVPLLIAVGVYVAKRNRRAFVGILVAAVLSLYLIRVALYLRGLPSHGLLPYLSYLPGLWDYDVTWDSIARNVLISFGIIGATAFQQPSIDTSVFWVSINPLPGEFVGWYDAAANLRINIYTPYAGVGELANYGYPYLIVYFLVVGFVLAMFERQVQRLIGDGLETLSLALVGLTGLFVLYSIQYNLRTSTRMLVYGIIAAIIVGWIHRRVVARRNRLASQPARPRPRTLSRYP